MLRMTSQTGNPTDFESFLTWEALTDVLSYDPATGEFRWVKSARAGWAGRIAGYVNPAHGGYREITLSKRTFRTSRLAWLYQTKQWPAGVVDHINGDPADDRWENLRDIPVAENALNKSLHGDNNTGVPGVHWDTGLQRYVARLAIGRERKYLGSFLTLEEAAAARRAAEEEHYREFRREQPAPRIVASQPKRVALSQQPARRGVPADVRSGLNHAILTRLLSYDAATGEFRWLETTRGETKVGPIAGKTLKKGYRQIGIGGRVFYAHRLAWLYMTGKWPADLVDHKDGNPSNNAWANLRAATRSQNNANRIAAPSKSGITGVHWHTQRGKWSVRASHNNKLLYLGLFDTIEEAAAARAAFDERMRGGFSARAKSSEHDGDVNRSSSQVKEK